jgi:uncharacterized protein YceK
MKSVCAVLTVVTMILSGCATNKSAATCESCASGTAAKVATVDVADTACCEPVGIAGATQPVAVVDSLALIKSAFNAHADKPRVVLLVSPACSECVLGAQAVRKSIVDRFAERSVYAIVVWQPMLETDNEAAAKKASAIFDGTTAVQFYDPERIAGWAYERERFSRKWDEVEAALPPDHWLRAAHDRKPDRGPEWDIYIAVQARRPLGGHDAQA